MSSRHPIGTPRGTPSTGAVIAVGAWLSQRGLCPPMGQPWSIEVALGPHPLGTSFYLHILSEEWRYTFTHDNRVSSIRVLDIPCVHDRDDHQLLPLTPPLRDIGTLVRKLEQRYNIRFHRKAVAVRTSLAGAEPVVQSWATTL